METSYRAASRLQPQCPHLGFEKGQERGSASDKEGFEDDPARNMEGKKTKK